MAVLNQVEVFGTTYDLQDTAAQEAILDINEDILELKTDLDDNVEELSKVRFVTITPNILDLETYTVGMLSSINGNISQDSDWRTTDFLLLKDDISTLYVSVAYAAFRYIWYTAPNKDAHIGDYGSQTVTKTTLTPPTGAKYIRVSYVVLSGDTTRDYDHQYISYNDRFEDFMKLPLSDDVETLVTKMGQVIAENPQNLLDPNNYTSGYLSSISGTIKASNDWRTTGYLPIDNDKSVYVSFGYPAFRYIWYADTTENAHVGDYGNETVAKTSLTPPTGARYIRVSYAMPSGNYDYSSQYISYNNQYVPYGEKSYSVGEAFAEIIQHEVSESNPFASVRIVSKDGKADYTSISAAVADASDGDTIYVLPGSYEEAVHVERKHISIIGLSKADCVLWNDYGDYAECPLYMTSGYLKNMTIKAIQKQSDEGKTSNIPYCVHIDVKYPTDNNLRKFEIENCDFISDWSDCLGCGTADKAELIVRNCYLENTNKSFRYPFAYHNTTSASNAKITLENNRMVNNGTGAYCVYLYDYNYESLVDVELIGNTAKSVVNGVTNQNLVLNANDNAKFSLVNTSHGNNIESMNYTN